MISVVLLILGYGFLLLGLIGLIFPILPGWIFIFVGLLVLARQASWAKKALNWFKARHPRVRAIIERAETISTRWIPPGDGAARPAGAPGGQPGRLMPVPPAGLVLRAASPDDAVGLTALYNCPAIAGEPYARRSSRSSARARAWPASLGRTTCIWWPSSKARSSAMPALRCCRVGAAMSAVSAWACMTTGPGRGIGTALLAGPARHRRRLARPQAPRAQRLPRQCAGNRPLRAPRLRARRCGARLCHPRWSLCRFHPDGPA